MKESLLDLLEVTKEELNPEIKKYRLYCDLDGVLCDFKGRFEHLFGKGPREVEQEKSAAYFWAMIRNVGAKYWARMPWTPGGQVLWSAIKVHNPMVLTAPPRSKDFQSFEPTALEGKEAWVVENLSISANRVIFRSSKKKQEIAEQDVAKGLIPILIDDREDTIARWNQAGGIGVHHPENGDPSEVIKKIKELYERDSTEERV